MTDRCSGESPGPLPCLEAFNRITEQLGGMSAKMDSIHEQTSRINGHVARLFQRTSRHETQIRLLRSEVDGASEGRATWGRRLWQALIGLGLLVAGYLLKS